MSNSVGDWPFCLQVFDSPSNFRGLTDAIARYSCRPVGPRQMSEMMKPDLGRSPAFSAIHSCLSKFYQSQAAQMIVVLVEFDTATGNPAGLGLRVVYINFCL